MAPVVATAFFHLQIYPKFYLSFTILVSLILVKYPDRIGPVNTVVPTVPRYQYRGMRYTAQLNIHLIPHDHQARARHQPAPESGSLQSDGTWRSAQLAAPRARAGGEGCGHIIMAGRSLGRRVVMLLAAVVRSSAQTAVDVTFDGSALLGRKLQATGAPSGEPTGQPTTCLLYTSPSPRD